MFPPVIALLDALRMSGIDRERIRSRASAKYLYNVPNTHVILSVTTVDISCRFGFL